MSSNAIVKKIRYSLRWIPDEPYIQLNYFARFHRFANLINPYSYNEKINWIKLHDHNPVYTKLVDKLEVKSFVMDKIGKEYVIPTLGSWDSFDDIEIESMPDKFVLKCTHDSEGIIIVKDKNSLNLRAAKKKLETALHQNFFYIGREWAYKNVVPRILAEPYLEDCEYGELRDYKFFCFDGEPKALYIASNRSIDDVKFDYYDMEFKHLDIRQKYQNSSENITKPVMFDEMVRISKELSKGFKHVRVDLYEVNKEVYFGELTFYPLGGFIPFDPPVWDEIFGEWLKL